MIAFIREKKEVLKKALIQSSPPFIFNEETRLETFTFSLHIFLTERNNLYSTLRDNILHIACPVNTDFKDTLTQKAIRTIIEKALKYEAKRILPARLLQLAQQHNFSFTGVSINSSKKRWGSCSGGKKINLSSSLLLLPPHLIDYVLLHELCHTREMNHSTNFWNQMNLVTHGNAKNLRQEFKSYQTF
ncbi:MAG: M48 family metallopeptidase [Tannerellaceae bacterium]|nr:M48 family metallopeptidase [Tannerellaceae bacterium]